MANLPAGFQPVNTDIPLLPAKSTIPPLPANFTPAPAYLQREPQAPVSQAPGFLEDVSSRLQGRRGELTDTFESLAAGTLPVDRAFTQAIGKGIAGPVVDVTGAGMSSVARKFVGLLPTSFTQGAEAQAAKAWDYITNTVAGEEALLYAKQGADAYAGWKTRNPADAKTLESIVNIGSLIGPARNANPSTLGGWASRLEASAQKGRMPFVTDLVLPERTKKVRTEEVTRTTQRGPLLANVTEPSRLEAEAIAEVSKLPVTSTRSPQYNYNLVRDRNFELAQKLEADLDAANIQVNPADVAARMDTDVQKLIANSAVITGDVERTANKVKDYAMTLFQSSNGTAADLLRTRRQFDRWVSSQKGDAAFDAERLNALNLSVRQVRATLNDFLDGVAPNQQVKESLKTQSRLYYAMDNIQDKAAAEASTMVGRLMQNIHRATGGSLPTTPLALGATAAAGGGLVMSGWLPYAVVPVAAAPIAYAVYKGATSPLMRQQLATMFKSIDKAIKSTSNQQMRATLAKDRLALLELMKTLPAEKEQNE